MNEEDKYKQECQEMNRLITGLTLSMSGCALVISGIVLCNVLLLEHIFIGIIAISLGVVVIIVGLILLILELKKRRKKDVE